MPKSTRRWRKASVDDIDVYMPWNVPIEAPGQTLAFGPFESRVEAIVPSIEGERAGDRDSDRNGGDGDVDGTTSGGGIDLIQVEAVLLATESVYGAEENESRTYQSRPGHPPITQNVRTDSLDDDGDVEESKSSLSAKPQKSKQLT